MFGFFNRVSAMFRHCLHVCGVVILSLVLVRPSRGDITFGNPASAEANDFPFSGLYQDVDAATRYQQVYVGSNFGGSPIEIGSVIFYAYGVPVNADGTYILSLSTTSAAVDALDSNMATNVGADNFTFFSGTLPMSVGATMTLTLPTPFNYDPTAGNLLLDIQISGVTNFSVAPYVAENGDFNGLSSRMVNGFASGTADFGLVTTFGSSTLQSVPEPSSLGLAAVGSLACAGYFWSRRCARD
jgi:hypothetical protein